MSFQDMAWAVEQKCSSAGQKLVLLMLANYSNSHTGQCNPSHKRLAEDCSMGVSTLKRNLDSLQDEGFLTVIHKSLEGVSLPNQYRLAIHKLEGVGPNRAGGESKLDGGVGPNRATNPEVKPVIKPVLRQPVGFASSTALNTKVDQLPFVKTESVIDLFHEVLPELPRVKLLSDKRKKAISSFCKWVLTSKRPDGQHRAQTADEVLVWVRSYFERARDNDFLMGRGARTGTHANWECDIDFLLSDKGMKQVIEKTRELAA